MGLSVILLCDKLSRSFYYLPFSLVLFSNFQKTNKPKVINSNLIESTVTNKLTDEILNGKHGLPLLLFQN